MADDRHLAAWLKKHGTNPVTGERLSANSLITLHFHRNEDGEYCCPATMKVFTDNSHIVALRNTGNVFSYEAIERLNIKPKNYKDLVSNEPFTRADIITLQDPHNLSLRDMTSFKYIQDGVSPGGKNGYRTSNPENAAVKSTERILKAQRAVEQLREKSKDPNHNPNLAKTPTVATNEKIKPAYNTATYTTGTTAASLTSTTLSPITRTERAIISDEDYLLKHNKIKIKGYAQIKIKKMGSINVELHTDYAPTTVYNFVMLAKQGYYRNVSFHRNIKNFMIQGGDPTGTGKGGTSYWKREFKDEFQNPLKHDSRGVLSMANKGINSNSSQFFITYKEAPHLDKLHTIFGKVVGGFEVLDQLEELKVDSDKRPWDEVLMSDIVIFVDPFEEFMKQRKENEEEEERRIEAAKHKTKDDLETWTGRNLAAPVDKSSSEIGKYISKDNGVLGTPEEVYEPVKKKNKVGGFGDFSSW